MAALRKPFEGVQNIIRFNWPMFLGSVLISSLCIVAGMINMSDTGWLFMLAGSLILGAVLVSLVVSWYVYDGSGLYEFTFLKGIQLPANARILNIHSGFDESSPIIRGLFPEASLVVLDFYDPDRHTEPSIRRARQKYPASGNRSIRTMEIGEAQESAHLVILFFAAHEIRDTRERSLFFQQLTGLLVPGGQIVVVEHLRDWQNFLAYNFGFLHFYSADAWRRAFRQPRLQLVVNRKLNPFVNLYILKNDGTAP